MPMRSFGLLLMITLSAYGQNPATPSASGSQGPDASHSIHPHGDYVTVNGTKLWYESEGSGPPLLLIAGGPGLSHSYLHPHFSQLAKSYRVVYFDAYGTGKSDVAHDPHQYSFNRDVENVEGLRNALHLGQINVLGHSYGGFVAQAYALRFPASVQKLVLVDTQWGAEMMATFGEYRRDELHTLFPDAWERVMKAHSQGFHTCSKEYEDAEGETGDFGLTLLFYDVTQARKLMETAEPTNHEVNCTILGDDAGFVLAADIAKLDFRPELKNLHMPTLIVAGRYDRILPPRYQEQFHKYAPQAQVMMFEKSGHFPFIEEPEEFIRVVSEFLSK